MWQHLNRKLQHSTIKAPEARHINRKNNTMHIKPQMGDILISTTGFYLGIGFHIQWTFKTNAGGIN
jgi:hypothetical protein